MSSQSAESTLIRFSSPLRLDHQPPSHVSNYSSNSDCMMTSSDLDHHLASSRMAPLLLSTSSLDGPPSPVRMVPAITYHHITIHLDHRPSSILCHTRSHQYLIPLYTIYHPMVALRSLTTRVFVWSSSIGFVSITSTVHFTFTPRPRRLDSPTSQGIIGNISREQSWR